MKRLLFLLSVLISTAVAVAADPVSVVYRGRLQRNGREPSVSQVAVSFRLYETKDSAAPLWKKDVTVQLDATGTFQCALNGKDDANVDLDGLVQAGRIGAIALAVAGGREQYPRQDILTVPVVRKTAKACGLAKASPIAEAVTAEKVTADSIRVADLDTKGKVSLGDTQALTADLEIAPWRRLRFLGSTTVMRPGNGFPIYLGQVTLPNTEFGPLSESGMVLFSCLQNDGDSRPPMPALTMVYGKNQNPSVISYHLPAGTKVRAWFFPFGVQ